MSSTSAIRTILSKSPQISTLAPTKDLLLGTELLLLPATRQLLRSSYASLLSTSQSSDAAQTAAVVSTSLNTSISFLQSVKLFQDMSRDNDLSYYKVGRGKVGTDEDTGEKYSFDMQKLGHKHCIPRSMVSEGEKLKFGGMLLQLALGELNGAKEEAAAVGGATPLLGASVFMNTTAVGDLECIENQFHSVMAADTPMPDVFCVEGCEGADSLERLRELVKRNEKRMVRLSGVSTTGQYKENDFDSEVGFDTPVVVVREGQVDEIL